MKIGPNAHHSTCHLNTIFAFLVKFAPTLKASSQRRYGMLSGYSQGQHRGLRVGAKGRDIYTNFAVDNFKQAGKGIEEEAVHLAYDTFLGVTLYVQRIMKDAFNITPHGNVCDVDTVRRLIDGYLMECDSRLREQLSFITESQKELLYAINNESSPVKNITSASFVNSHRMKSPSSVQSAARK